MDNNMLSSQNRKSISLNFLHTEFLEDLERFLIAFRTRRGLTTLFVVPSTEQFGNRGSRCLNAFVIQGNSGRLENQSINKVIDQFDAAERAFNGLQRSCPCIVRDIPVSAFVQQGLDNFRVA